MTLIALSLALSPFAILFLAYGADRWLKRAIPKAIVPKVEVWKGKKRAA